LAGLAKTRRGQDSGGASGGMIFGKLGEAHDNVVGQTCHVRGSMPSRVNDRRSGIHRKFVRTEEYVLVECGCGQSCTSSRANKPMAARRVRSPHLKILTSGEKVAALIGKGG
jgi:hypothetical protein